MTEELIQNDIRPAETVITIVETGPQRGDKPRTLLAKLAAMAKTAATAALAAGEAHIGSVGGHTKTVDVVFSLDTSGAYASGDVLADRQALAAAMRVNDGTGVLSSLVLNDKDDQGVALDVVLLSADVTLGAESGAVAITDANADNILGIFRVAADDWIDLGGCRVATIRNINLPVKPAAGTQIVYAALITRGAPTHTASGITGRFTFLQD